MYDFARSATVALAAILLCGLWHDGARAEPPPGSAEKAAEKTAQKNSGPTCDRAAFRLVLDVGHTAKAFGATSARGQREYDFNLRLAKSIDHKLRANWCAASTPYRSAAPGATRARAPGGSSIGRGWLTRRRTGLRRNGRLLDNEGDLQ